MENNRTSYASWARLASISGIFGILCYFFAAFVPLPDTLARLLIFAFGPALVISFLGVYHTFAVHRDGIILQVACLFGILAGFALTIMLVVQVGNNMVRADLLATADSEAIKENIKVAWGAANRVQYLVDVVWDIFITGALMLLGVVLLSHPRFGKIWGGSGILINFALLVLNLYSFPYPPGESGYVDLGPLAAIWMFAVFVRIFFIKWNSPKEQIELVKS